MLKAYDHTDALRSPMLELALVDHRARVRDALRCPDPFAGLEPGDLTHVPHDYSGMQLRRPAESLLFGIDPHTRVGY